MTVQNLTERQQKWFASVQASLERDTGKTLAQWVEIARRCPETAHRARLKWFKEQHGLLQNRASHVLSAVFETQMGWSDPDALIDTVWVDTASRDILEAVDSAARALPGTLRTARKSFTAWSRKVQFAALRPVKGGGAMLGVAVPPEADPRLEAPRSESWSERLKSRMALANPAAVDSSVVQLLSAAWEKA